MRLPIINAKQMMKILNFLGYEFVRQKGSHMFFRNLKTGKTTIIPNHHNEKLDSSLLLKIIKKDLLMSRDDFIKISKKVLIV